MKKTITTLTLAIITSALALAITYSMYVHFTGANGDSIVDAIADVDSIVYYAPEVPPATSGTFTDSRDNNTYNWVTIGEQIWMAENLKATQYADGTAIPHVTDNTAWGNLGDNDTDKAYCFYNNDASAGYGALYTYAAATNGDNSGNNVQGVCPTGWHLPSDAEWTTLEDALTGDNKGSQLAANADLWHDGVLENAAEFGTSGFSALPGGFRNFNNGSFLNQGSYGHWWSSAQYSSSTAYGRDLSYSYGTVCRFYYIKSVGFSVRCVADVDSIVYYAPAIPSGSDYTQPSGTFTDSRDNNTYNWVTIGEQIWMAENLKATQYADGTAIPHVTDNTAWANLGNNDTDKAYCFYNNDASAGYGALYTYAAATNGDNSGNNVQGVCPTGWHLPSDAEWTTLEDALTGDNKGSQLAANADLWHDGVLENAAEFGTSGFSALPGGGRYYDDGTFDAQGGYCSWWSSTQDGSSYACGRGLGCGYSTVGRSNSNKSNGFSVRCLRD